MSGLVELVTAFFGICAVLSIISTWKASGENERESD
jgi:hypothetical protein